MTKRKIVFTEDKIVDDFRKGTADEEAYEKGQQVNMDERSAAHFVELGVAEFVTAKRRKAKTAAAKDNTGENGDGDDDNTGENGDGGDDNTGENGNGGDDNTGENGDGGDDNTGENGDGGDDSTGENGDGGDDSTGENGNGGDDSTGENGDGAKLV